MSEQGSNLPPGFMTAEDRLRERRQRRSYLLEMLITEIERLYNEVMAIRSDLADLRRQVTEIRLHLTRLSMGLPRRRRSGTRQAGQGGQVREGGKQKR